MIDVPQAGKQWQTVSGERALSGIGWMEGVNWMHPSKEVSEAKAKCKIKKFDVATKVESK